MLTLPLVCVEMRSETAILQYTLNASAGDFYDIRSMAANFPLAMREVVRELVFTLSDIRDDIYSGVMPAIGRFPALVNVVLVRLCRVSGQFRPERNLEGMLEEWVGGDV